MNKRLQLQKLDDRNDEFNGVTLSYKMYIKFVLDAMELYHSGIRAKDIQVNEE